MGEGRGELSGRGVQNRNSLVVQESRLSQVLKSDAHPIGETVAGFNGQNGRRKLHADDIFLRDIEVRRRYASDPDGVTVEISMPPTGHGNQAILVAGHGSDDQAKIVRTAILVGID